MSVFSVGTKILKEVLVWDGDNLKMQTRLRSTDEAFTAI